MYYYFDIHNLVLFTTEFKTCGDMVVREKIVEKILIVEAGWHYIDIEDTFKPLIFRTINFKNQTF